MNKKPLFASLFLYAFHSAIGQNTESEMEYHVPSNTACISETEYAEILQQSNENASRLNLHEKIQKKSTAIELLDWPTRKAEGFNDCDYYIITNHVDNDKTTGIKDYNCGSRTYDGHRGTDITLWPYPFYKLDNNQVEVIAAKTGVIVNKADGNFDKKCVGSDYQRRRKLCNVTTFRWYQNLVLSHEKQLRNHKSYWSNHIKRRIPWSGS